MDYYCAVVTYCGLKERLSFPILSNNAFVSDRDSRNVLMNNIQNVVVAPFRLYPTDTSFARRVMPMHTMFTGIKLFENTDSRAQIRYGIARRYSNQEIVFIKIKHRKAERGDREYDRTLATKQMERFDWGPFVILVRHLKYYTEQP